MIKSEIFASVLRDVCEVTGISERDIMSKSKSEEIVDARHLLVVTLRRSGYYPGMIAERLHISGRAVRKMIGSFRSRADFLGSSIADEAHLALYVRDVVDDPDQADGFIFNRWYADTVRSGIPVDWEGIL